MDEQLLRKLSRQLKLLNFLLVFFTLIFVVGFVLAGFLAYQAAREVRDAKNSLNSLQGKAQQNLDLKSKLCDSPNSALSRLLTSQSDVCE